MTLLACAESRRSSNRLECTPPELVACTCSDGRSGTKVCESTECQCPSIGGPDTGSDGGLTQPDAESFDSGTRLIRDSGFEDAAVETWPDANQPVDTGPTPSDGGPPPCLNDLACNAPIAVCESGSCVVGCVLPGSPIRCGAQEECDSSTGRCRSIPMTCASDAECGAPTGVCNSDGQCVPGCQEPTGTACGTSEICNPGTGRCEGCNSDSHCQPPSTICVARSCTPGCAEPSGQVCLGGTVCNTSSGRCAPPPAGCSTDASCAPPATVCERGACVPGCGEPQGLTCGAGESCDSATGRCGVLPGLCLSDGNCDPPRYVCESFQCVEGCTPGSCGVDSCNPLTGRCGAFSICILDFMCSPPETICEGNVCVPSCTEPGGVSCGQTQACDPSDGRCVSTCSIDEDCSPPFSVCSSGACTSGCANGGPACMGSEVCDSATGRCGPCTQDSQCGPPQSVCERGACTPGCGEAGGATCSIGQFCQLDHGRCEAPGTGALGSSCTRDNDCGSGQCSASLGVCTAACSRALDCPAGFGCVEVSGGHRCVPAAAVSGATFSLAAGAACSSPGQCRSNLCDGGACVDVCAENGDCTGGLVCRMSERPAASSDFVTACGASAGTLDPGQACTAGADCRSGVCDNDSCRALCSSTADCPAGLACLPSDASVCTQPLGTLCLGYELNFATICRPAGGGMSPVGAACTEPETCRTGLCNTGLGECSDMCGRDSDCPSGYVCKLVEFGTLGTLGLVPYYLNACTPRGA